MTISRTPRRARTIAVLAVGLAALAGGCATETTADTVDGPTSGPPIDRPDEADGDSTDSETDPPTPTSQAIEDGDHTGRLVAITTEDVTVELVRTLTGDEAVAAATADGGEALDDDGALPNDVYIQDLDRAVTIPVAGDGGFRIYDCSGGCELIGTTLDALASGQAAAAGGPNAVVDLTVDQGAVVSFEERYLP
jgi:hypothetical protein